MPPPTDHVDKTNGSRSIRLTIVVGSVDCSSTIDACLDALIGASRGIECEILVVDASVDNSAEIALRHDGVRVVTEPPGTLVPVLWGRGIAMAEGDVVALTIGTFVVSLTWATALIDTISSGAAGAGGPIRLAPSTGSADAAVYFLRYSSYLPTDMGKRDVRDIAGDNAAYSMTALRQTAWNEDRGFWETEVNESLRESGYRLTIDPAAESTFLRGPGIRAFAVQRFTHARLFGKWRVETGGESRLGILLRSPLVPLVMISRIATRTMPHIEYRPQFARGFPVLVWFAVCWAAGEALGAMEAGRRLSPKRAPDMKTGE